MLTVEVTSDVFVALRRIQNELGGPEITSLADVVQYLVHEHSEAVTYRPPYYGGHEL